MTIRRFDIQGRFMGMPYDWRLPRLAKVKARIYDPRGPLFPPKVFGMGWTINLAHPGAKWIFGAMAVFVICALFLG